MKGRGNRRPWLGQAGFTPGRSLHEASRLLVREEQAFDLATQLVIGSTGLLEECHPTIPLSPQRVIENPTNLLPSLRCHPAALPHSRSTDWNSGKTTSRSPINDGVSWLPGEVVRKLDHFRSALAGHRPPFSTKPLLPQP